MIFKRKIIDEVLKFLDLEEIIVLHGARQVGKTHILLWIKDFLDAKKEITYYIDLEDSRLKRILDAGVDEFITHLREEGYLSGDKEKIYVFIDEIQYLDNPSEFLKLIADHHKNIKLMVSGSSSFEIKSKFKDSLVGRTINFEIFGLSFEEYLMFRSFNFNRGLKMTDKKQEELRALYKDFVLFGSYPRIALTLEIGQKEKRLQQIIDTYIRKDVKELANIENIAGFNHLLEALAAQSGQMINVRELSVTCKLSVPTVEKYLFILEQTYIIRLVRPFYRNVRSELSKTPKVFFYDSGIMQMLWLKSLQKEMLGSCFETSIFSELAKKYGRDNINYWRTKDKREIDFIIRDKNDLIPLEVKTNFQKSSTAALTFFRDNYRSKNYIVVGLDGRSEKDHEKYPWEI